MDENLNQNTQKHNSRHFLINLRLQDKFKRLKTDKNTQNCLKTQTRQFLAKTQLWTKIRFWVDSKPSKTYIKQILNTLEQENKGGFGLDEN